MKKKLMLLVLTVFVYAVSIASGEKIYYKAANGTLYDQSSLPAKFDPCATATFQVQYTVPAGHDGLCRVEWYDQAHTPWGTTTTNEITITLVPGRVIACTVYYYGGNANPCANVTQAAAPGLTLSFKTIGLSTPVANPSIILAGCQNAVSFSTAFASADNNHFVPSAGTYSVSWNFPSGWTNSPQDLTTSATPDASSNGGNVSATVTMSTCAYAAASPVLAVSRTLQTLTLSSSNPVTVCNGASSARFNLSNPTCGTTSYTYTVSGNAGATFSANGQQTLTTNDAFADLSFNGVPNQTELLFTAKANYPGGNSSSSVSASFNYGLPYWIGGVTGEENTVCPSSEQYLSVPFYSGSPVSNYEWTVTSQPFPEACVFDPGGSTTAYGQFVDAYFYAPGYYDIQVMAPTVCGPAYTYGTIYVTDCFRKITSASSGTKASSINGAEQLYPNPANEVVKINLANIIPSDNGIKGVSRVKIQLLSLNGVTIRTLESTTGGLAVMDTHNLPAGTYIVRIVNGKQLINRKVVVRH